LAGIGWTAEGGCPYVVDGRPASLYVVLDINSRFFAPLKMTIAFGYESRELVIVQS